MLTISIYRISVPYSTKPKYSNRTHMKRLGQILHISKQNEIVIRGDEKKFSGSMKELPRINSLVLDKSIKPIGKVSGIFGPVDQPYFTLKPDKRVIATGLEKLVNERVYVQ